LYIVVISTTTATKENIMTRIAAITALAITLILLAPAILLLITGDFPGSTRFYGLEEDHMVVDLLLTLVGK
jgi:hypothetical protein